MLDAVRAETGWVHFRERTFAKTDDAQMASEHLAIVGALESRNPSLAEEKMRTHLETIARMLDS